MEEHEENGLKSQNECVTIFTKLDITNRKWKIDGIDNGEGDLTKRVRVISNDEIADLGNGINLFMDKLQEILKLIIENTNYMENVVAEVDGSVVKSNDSASDLSAMTEELSATMQDVGLSVNTINDNADAIRKDVEIIATKSDDINKFSKELKKQMY